MSLRQMLIVSLLFLSLGSHSPAQEPLVTYGSPPVFQPERYAHLQLTPAQLAAAQRLELAQYHFILWAHFEWPAKLRDLDNRIALTRAEVQSLERRVREFRRYYVPVNEANPFFEDLENRQLALEASRRTADQLEYERGLMQQQQVLEYQLRWQEVTQARLALRQAK